MGACAWALYMAGNISLPTPLYVRCEEAFTSALGASLLTPASISALGASPLTPASTSALGASLPIYAIVPVSSSTKTYWFGTNSKFSSIMPMFSKSNLNLQFNLSPALRGFLPICHCTSSAHPRQPFRHPRTLRPPPHLRARQHLPHQFLCHLQARQPIPHPAPPSPNIQKLFFLQLCTRAFIICACGF